jgi:hypothetical protein
VHYNRLSVLRLLLIHWNEEEGAACVRILRAAGFDARHLAPRGSAGLRPLREDPPDAFVIDLSRIPSHGCAVAIDLRQKAATRAVPIVFVGGAPEKIAKVRKLLLDAAYVQWDDRIGDAIRSARANAPRNPVVPGTMDAYAGTPLAKKLGIRTGTVVALLDAPPGFKGTLGALPDGARISTNARDAASLVLLFASSLQHLRHLFPQAVRLLKAGGSIWMAWPKKTSGTATDLSAPAVRAFGLAAGFVDYRICAIDRTWSGLLFVRRASARSAARQ